MKNSKVVEDSKGFLRITVNPPSDDWPLKCWPLNICFNPKARDMAPNDAIFFLFILERSQEQHSCRRLCGLSRFNSKLAVGRLAAEKLADDFVIKVHILNFSDGLIKNKSL